MAARDIVVIGFILFALGMGFFILNFTMNTTVDHLLNTSQINESADVRNAFSSMSTVVNRLDYVIFALFIGLTLGLIISGWFVGGNAIFMFIYFLIVSITIAICTVLSNIWVQVSESSVFGTTVVSFPTTNHILSYLPYYITVIGIIGLIVMFAKPYFEGGY